VRSLARTCLASTRRGLLAAATAALAVSVGAATPAHAAHIGLTPGMSAPGRDGAATITAAQQVLSHINHVRAGGGLPAYTMLSGLVASGRAHDLRMASGCGLSHQCPGEATFSARISAQGVRWTTAGENIGMGGPVAATPPAIAAMAMRLTDSMLAEVAPNDGHRRNLLSSTFHNIGIALYRDMHGTVWMTQDFTN